MLNKKKILLLASCDFYHSKERSILEMIMSIFLFKKWDVILEDGERNTFLCELTSPVADTYFSRSMFFDTVPEFYWNRFGNMKEISVSWPGCQTPQIADLLTFLGCFVRRREKCQILEIFFKIWPNKISPLTWRILYIRLSR